MCYFGADCARGGTSIAIAVASRNAPKLPRVTVCRQMPRSEAAQVGPVPGGLSLRARDLQQCLGVDSFSIFYYGVVISTAAKNLMTAVDANNWNNTAN